MDQFTELLELAARGEKGAEAEFVEAVHGELRRLAAREFRREHASHTLQTTALVNEAYLRLFSGKALAVSSRQHFYHVAARTMRRILVDHARSKQAAKRPSKLQRVELEDNQAFTHGDPETILSIHQALEKLQALDPRLAQIVELRFFAGMSVDETAALLDTSDTTIKREFAVARAFLERELRSTQE